jgi:hypothetical protein
MPLPSTTYSTIQQLLNDINTRFVPNGMELITGDIGNSQLNGLANFIVTYTLNSGLAGISSSTGVVPLSKPVTLFTVVPTSIHWPDNIQNEYYIINATASNIPLTSGYSYVDQYATSQTVIPARASIHIAKATNGSWVQINNLPGVGVLPPQTGHEGEYLTTNGTSASWLNTHLSLTSGSFEPDGISYINTGLVNNKLSIWLDAAGRFIYESLGEWQYLVGGGFQITSFGFDANANDYHLEVFLKGLNS